jgi:hypothetical protein
MRALAGVEERREDDHPARDRGDRRAHAARGAAFQKKLAERKRRGRSMIIGGIVFAELVFLARCNASLKEIQGAKPVAVAEEGSIRGLTEAVLYMGIPLAAK